MNNTPPTDKPRQTASAGVEINWAAAAIILGVSPREARNVIARYPKLCTPIREGHRTVVLKLNQVLAVKQQRRLDAIKRGSK